MLLGVFEVTGRGKVGKQAIDVTFQQCQKLFGKKRTSF